MMDAENNSPTAEGRKGRGKIKVVKKVLMILACFFLVVFFIVPIYLSSESGRRFIVERINGSVDGKVEMGDFSVGWFRGVRVKDLKFHDKAGTTSVNVKEISTRPHYAAILLGEISFGKTLVDRPEVVIDLKEGKGADSDTVSAAREESGAEDGKKDKKGTGSGLEKIDLTVKDGDVTINLKSVNRELRSVKFKDIQSQLDLKPAGSKSSFNIALAVADGDRESKISAKGELKPAAKRNWTLKGTSGDFTVKVDALDLESLGPLFALAGRDIEASGTLDADITAKIDDGRFEKLDAKALLSGFSRQIAGKEAVLEEPVKIEARILSDDDGVRIDKLNMKSSFCQIDCAGGANWVDYTATADLEGLQGFAGQFADFGDYTVRGKVTEKGRIFFDKGTIRAAGAATFEKFAISDGKQTTPATGANMDFDVEMDRDKDILKITSVEMSSDIGKVATSDSIVPLGKEARGELTLGISADVDLKKCEPFGRLFGVIPADMEIAGGLEGKVSVSKEKRGYHVVTNNAKVENFRLAQAGEKPFADKLITVSLDMLADPEEKSLQIDDLRLEGSAIKIVKGRFSESSRGGTTKMIGELEAEYDLAAVSAVTSAFIPEGLTMEGKRTTKIKVESEYPKGQREELLANLDTEAKFGFDRAEYMGLNFGPVETEVKVEGGVLTIAPFSAKVNNGKLNFAGGVNLKTKPMMLKTPKPMRIVEGVSINDKASRAMLKFINPIFARAVNVRGVANFHCEQLSIPLAGARQNDAVVVGTIAMDNVRLEASDFLGQIVSLAGGSGANMTVMPTRFELRNGVLSYDDMQINVGDNPVNFSGAIGLNKRIKMNVTLPYTLSGRTARVGEESAERITLPIEGSVDNPKINTKKLLEIEAQKLIEREIQRGLERWIR